METIIIISIFLTTLMIAYVESKLYKPKEAILPTVYDQCKSSSIDSGSPTNKRMRMTSFTVDV